MDLKAVTSTLEKLNFTVLLCFLYFYANLTRQASKAEIKAKFDEMNVDNSYGLSYEEFRELLKSLSERPTIRTYTDYKDCFILVVLTFQAISAVRWR